MDLGDYRGGVKNHVLEGKDGTEVALLALIGYYHILEKEEELKAEYQRELEYEVDNLEKEGYYVPEELIEMYEKAYKNLLNAKKSINQFKTKLVKDEDVL